MKDTDLRNLRVATDLPPSDPLAKQDTLAAVVVINEALPRLVAAARAGELAGLIVRWPARPLASFWSVALAPPGLPAGVALLAIRYAGSDLFDIHATLGVASVEWPAADVAAFRTQTARPDVSPDDLAFLRDALGALCDAHEKQGKPQIS